MKPYRLLATYAIILPASASGPEWSKPDYLLSSLVRALAAIAAFGVTAFDPVPAFAQTPNPLTITDVFKADQADVNPKALAAIRNFFDNANAQATCHPPRITAKVVVKKGGDPLFLENLAKARADVLEAELVRLGLKNKVRRVIDSKGDHEEVQLEFDLPWFEVRSEPPKGAKVKAGDQINVTIVAFHPTGVRKIALTADDGQFEEVHGDYGSCEVQHLGTTYTVPKYDPPPVVRLTSIVENAAGKPTSMTVEFPVEPIVPF